MANFTPQEIEQFLQEFFDTVGARQYIGARYVPIFGRAGSDTVEWDDLAPYEPLTVVMHMGVSYVSRRYVPAGIPITDTGYWVETYRFNAQVEQYRQEVLSFQGQIDEIREDFVPFPDEATLPKYGSAGQVLSTLTNGKTEWVDPVVPSDAQAEAVITAWLDEHPEATTTVQDGAITDAKVNTDATIYRLRGAFPNDATTLQAVRGSGSWVVNSAQLANITDLPSDITSGVNYMLMNFIFSGTASVQFFYPIYNVAQLWWRFATSSSAGSWYNVLTQEVTDSKLATDSTIMRFRQTLDSSVTTLASVKNEGSYNVPQSILSGITDLPSDAPTNIGYMLVNTTYTISGGSQYSVQMLVGLYNYNGVWFRIVTNNPASWFKIYPHVIGDAQLTDNSSIMRFRQILDSSVTTLASVRNEGSYNVPASIIPNLTDFPAEAPTNINYMLVNIAYTISSGNQYPAQFLIGLYNYMGIFYRTLSGGGPTSWFRIYPHSTSALENKKLVTAGDSYTAALFGATNPLTGHNFGWHIAQRNQMSFVNAGISGSIMALDKTYVDDPINVPIDTRNPFSYQRYTAIPADTDYLTLWFGINDASHTYLGTIDDTTNETFYGAWNVVLEYYLTNRPFMHVGIVVTVGSTAEYRQAVREVAAKWGYPVLDLVDGTDTPAFFDRDGMSTTARDLRRNAYGYNTWNAHPGPEWHEFISSAFEEFLKRC